MREPPEAFLVPVADLLLDEAAPPDFLAAVPLAFLLAVAVDFLAVPAEAFFVVPLLDADLLAEPVLPPPFAAPDLAEADFVADDFAPAPLVLAAFLVALLLVLAEEPAPLLLLAFVPLVPVVLALFARADVADGDFLAVVPAAFVVPGLVAPVALLADEADFAEVDFAAADLLPDALLEEDIEEERVAVAVALFALPEPAVFFLVSFSLVLVDFVAI